MVSTIPKDLLDSFVFPLVNMLYPVHLGRICSFPNMLEFKKKKTGSAWDQEQGCEICTVIFWTAYLSLKPRTTFWIRMTLSVMALSLSISKSISWWSCQKIRPCHFTGNTNTVQYSPEKKRISYEALQLNLNNNLMHFPSRLVLHFPSSWSNGVTSC